MAVFNAYNLKNQRLDSENLRTVLQFCSDNYAGAIASNVGTNPVTVSNSTATFSCDNAKFIVGGYLVDYEKQEGDNFTVDFSQIGIKPLYGLVVPFDIDSTDILTNDLTAYIRVINKLDGGDVSISIDSETGNYIINYGDTEKNWVYKYDTKFFSRADLSGDVTVYNCYVIPFACYYDNEAVQLLGYHTKDDLEEFLTDSAIAKLKSELEALFDDKFVWQEGGADKGDIGLLNVTDNKLSTIALTENNDPHVPIIIDGRVILPQYSANDYSYNKVLLVRNDGLVLPSVPSVNSGGTGATDKKTAKDNLGIQSGTADPASGFSGTPEKGDIYLKIVG